MSISFKKWIEAYDSRHLAYFYPSTVTPNDPKALLKQLLFLKGQQELDAHLGDPADTKTIRGQSAVGRIMSPQDWAVGPELNQASAVLRARDKHSPEDVAAAQAVWDREFEDRKRRAAAYKPQFPIQGTKLSPQKAKLVDDLIVRLKHDPADFPRIRAEYEQLVKQIGPQQSAF